jgi:hypothetical protein
MRITADIYGWRKYFYISEDIYHSGFLTVVSPFDLTRKGIHDTSVKTIQLTRTGDCYFEYIRGPYDQINHP